MARAKKQSEYGPAACANSTRSVRASRHGRARVRQRTGAEGGQAPPEMRFLVGFARPRAIVLRHTVRPSPDFGLPTRFEHTGYVDKRYEGNLDRMSSGRRTSRTKRAGTGTTKGRRNSCCGQRQRGYSASSWQNSSRGAAKWRCRCSIPVQKEAKPHRRIASS